MYKANQRIKESRKQLLLNFSYEKAKIIRLIGKAKYMPTCFLYERFLKEE